MPAFNAHGSSVLFASVAVGGLTSIGLPDESKEDVETTSHDSQGWRQYLPGLRDGGTVTLGARLVPDDAGQQALDDNYDGDEVVEVVISAAPDSESNVRTYTFSAHVKSRGGELPYDDVAERHWVLKVDGVVTQNSI